MSGAGLIFFSILIFWQQGILLLLSILTLWTGLWAELFLATRKTMYPWYLPRIFADIFPMSGNPPWKVRFNIRSLGTLWLLCTFFWALTGWRFTQLGILGANQIIMAAFFYIPLGVSILTDTAAYFGGRFFGGSALAPTISPKKTLSGLYSAIAALICIVLCFLLTFPFSYLVFLIFMVQAGAVGGDLLQSWAKRKLGLKDSSRLIPGHGGLWDRFDSLLGAMLTTAFLCAGGGYLWLHFFSYRFY